MRTVTITKEVYFPEAEGNKVYAVDVYVTVCKCMKVEAKDEDEAIAKASARLSSKCIRNKYDAEMIRALADEGFQDAEETEFKVSGEADENGEIQYY